MIKIGILSLPLNWNYGGILQQYALSEYLRKKNFTPILFSRRAHRKSFYKLFLVKTKWNIIKILNNLNCLNFLPLIATESFKKKFLPNKTKDFFSSKEINFFIQKKGTGGGWFGDLANARGGPSIFVLAAPRRGLNRKS